MVAPRGRAAGRGARLAVMATTAGRRVLTRRMALAAIMIGGGAVACGEAQPQPIAARLRPYWEPALEVATGSLEVLRTLTINSNAFARGSLSTDQFLVSIEAQWPSISALSQQVIPLDPAPDDQESHKALVAMVDAFVEVGPTVRGYRETEQPERLMHLVTLQQRVRGAARRLHRGHRAGTGPGWAAGAAGSHRGIDHRGVARAQARRAGRPLPGRGRRTCLAGQHRRRPPPLAHQPRVGRG